MAVEIRRFAPDLVDDYFRLFDDAFRDFPDWRGCFCAFYDDPCASADWDPEQVERNRGYREAVIDRGGAHGLLAYDEGEPIGWLNAAPRASYGNLRIFAAAARPDDPPVTGVQRVVTPGPYRAPDCVDERWRGIGIRIEDDVLVTDGGHDNLSADIPKDPDEVERLLADR